MKLARNAGSTSQILQVFIADSSSTTGAGLTGLTHNTSGLTAYYHRDSDTTATQVNLVTMTVGTFTSGGFKEIDATNMPGWYQFCPPNAALAAGAKSVGFHLKGAANMAPLPIEVDLESNARLLAQMTESYAANGTAPTGEQALFAIHQMMMQFLIDGSNLNVLKLDNSTTAFVVTLDSAITPTSARRQ